MAQAILRRSLLVGAIFAPIGALLHGLTGLAYLAVGAALTAAVVLVVEGWARRQLHRSGLRPLPSFGFVAWGLLPTFLAIVSLVSGPVRPPELVLGAFSLAWWTIAVLLVRGVRSALVPALVLLAVPSCVGVAMFVGRVVFVVREGGMERSDGYGSPALFLFLWIAESSLLLVPLTLIAWRLASARWPERFRSERLTPA
jgi:hypothetical protein